VSSLEERREEFKRYKRDVERRGKPFFPYAMFHDTVMSLVVVVVIVALAVVWRFTPDFGACEEEGIAKRDCTETGLLGPLYAEKAEPGTTSFIPRPDWYFYFLFYLLRIFKWPDSVVLGTVGIPTIILILMLLLPFVDRRLERRLLRRPVAIVITILTVLSMGVLTYKGATARETVGSEALAAVETWVERQGLSEEGRRGGEIFAQVGCMQCHTYLGSGSSNLGAPDLSEIGAREGRDVDYFVRYVRDPSDFGNTSMPPYENLGEENLRSVATFLTESKGEK
jgi:cytochrome c2